MRGSTILALQLVLTAAAASGARGQAQEAQPALEARVWLDRGQEPVLQRGDQIRIYYRTSEDAYAAIFRIDTDGAISMVFPQHPDAIDAVRGGRDYRLLLPEAPAWRVEDDPGVGYLFMVASPEPLDFSAFPYDPRLGWDLGAVSGVVYEDPYVAIDDYVALLVPDWDVVPYALDFLTYHVGNTYAYPRFLCYDCHTQRSYAAWNPYSAVCTSFRVVIWDDPYFYPTYRYSGTRVVVARPARALPRYEVVTRVAGDIGVRPLVRARTPPERRVARFKEAPAVDPSTRVPVRRAQPSAAPQAPPARQGRAPSAADQEDPRATGRPTLQRRPSGRLPTRTPPSAVDPRAPQARGVPAGAGRATPGREPTRPDARPEAPSSRPSARPTAPERSRPAARPGATPSSGPTPRPTARPGARPPSEPTPTTPQRSRPTARPSAPPSSRPPTRPSAPAPSRPTARPAPASGGPSARPAPAPREPASRPTVRPRGRTRGN